MNEITIERVAEVNRRVRAQYGWNPFELWFTSRGNLRKTGWVGTNGRHQVWAKTKKEVYKKLLTNL